MIICRSFVNVYVAVQSRSFGDMWAWPLTGTCCGDCLAYRSAVGAKPQSGLWSTLFSVQSQLVVSWRWCFICLLQWLSRDLSLLDVRNTERVRMLLNGEEMSRNSYVIPTAVLQKLLDAAHCRVSLFTFRQPYNAKLCRHARRRRSRPSYRAYWVRIRVSVTSLQIQ